MTELSPDRVDDLTEGLMLNWGTTRQTQASRAIFVGLSCDLLRSKRWQAFTAVSPLGTD